jgi:hypothetical protein
MREEVERGRKRGRERGRERLPDRGGRVMLQN